ncbi:PWI domain-containing protein [Chlamydoabsidia padenii]|nr:PWI domain-containing protein [Chlamydoabsidia padenii]
MGDAGYFKGTSADQDSRFSNKEKKLLKSMNFPREFDQKVQIKKVNLDVIKPWIANRVTQLLGFEDELVIDFAFGLLEEENLDPKRMQINLTGFLEKNTSVFMLDLWKLLLSAQNSMGGIPKEFIDQKKEELRLKKEQDERRRAEEEATMSTIRRKREDEGSYSRRDRRSRFDDSYSSPSSRYRQSSPPSYHRRQHYHHKRTSPSPYQERHRHYRSSRSRSRSPPLRRRRSSSPPPPPPRDDDRYYSRNKPRDGHSDSYRNRD